MENSYMNFGNFLKDLKNRENDSNGNSIPNCIDGDFCKLTPKNNNNGILTMAFVDIQPLDSVYSLPDSFSQGTLFPNLDKPFLGGNM